MRWMLCVIAILLASSLTGIGYIFRSIGRATHVMTRESESTNILSETIEGGHSVISSLIQEKRSPLRGELGGRTNILLLGKANENVAGQNLTDTIMVLSIDFSKKKVALLSLPRDLYVTLPDRNIATKLNALYQYDMANTENQADTVQDAVSLVTDLPIHYFVTLDYDGFSNAVDALGGISVYVPRDLFDPRFPGPHYSYETFEIKRGWRDLSGSEALKYVRERHADPDGDFGRAKRQQEVLSAIRNKVFSLEIILNPIAIAKIIDTIGHHVQTNLSPEDIRSLIALEREFDAKDISAAVIDAWKPESLLRVSHVQVGSVSMFILLPRTGNWNETREIAKNIFDLDTMQAEKEAITAESASIGIENQSGDPLLAERIRSLLTRDLHLEDVRVIHGRNLSSIPTSIATGFGGSRATRTLKMLSKKIGIRSEQTSLESPSENSDYDIILSLGEDLAHQFSFSEDSVDSSKIPERFEE